VKAGIQEEPKGLDIQSLLLVKEKLKVPVEVHEGNNSDTNSITDDTSINTDWVRYFNKQHIHYLIPIQSQGQNLGIIGIGKKGSGEDFDPDELDYVASLANLVVLNIKRIQLLEEQILNEQYESELALARTIQEGLLPANLPAITGLEVSATNIPSKQIGGDYYDLFQLPDGGHLISIADVTGKGVPAALLMANLQAMIHALALQDTTLEEATGTINDFIYNHTPSDKFITFFWAKLLVNGRTLRFVNAGHDYPLWFRASNSGVDHFQTEPTELKDGGLLLGAIPTLQPYGITEIELACDDILVFFTDGVTEAMNPETQEEFGLERLIQLVQNNRNQSAEVIKDKIITEVNRFSTGVRFDDLTLIVIRKQ
jgi:sigma-B regulation protein RsbU (phosphoserine phosphatase)